MLTTEFIQAIEGGATVLTGSRRLARYLTRQFNQVQHAAGRQVWPTPRIMPFAVWLDEVWRTSLPGEGPATLLGPAQEQVLWETVIADSPYASDLLQLSAAARTAADAWKLIHAWDLRLPFDTPFLNEDAQAFLEWAERYTAKCQSRSWVDPATLPDVVRVLVEQGQARLPGEILLAGFEELTPQQRRLFDGIQAAGCQIQLLTGPRLKGRAVRIATASTEAEIAAVAHWVRKQLAEHGKLRIGVVVPRLDSVRDRLTRIFDDLLVPIAVLPKSNVQRPYDISLGRRLSEYPIIHSAFLVLALARGSLPSADMGMLLRSPFIAGGESELTRRALLDGRLRQIGELEVSLNECLRLVGTAPDQGRAYACPLLAIRLSRWQEQVPHMLARRLAPSAWADLFSRLLNILGWPGERSLSSEEYQTVEAWRALLSSFVALDMVHPTLDFGSALSRLRRMASDTLFQPEGEDVPVQIMGILEASGMQFDRLWVMGMHDGAWPEAPRPNPFVPTGLQRKHDLPHASPARELAFAEQLTTGLEHAAPEVVFSYPLREGDLDLRPSPLVLNVDEVEPHAFLGTRLQTYRDIIYLARRTESLQDGQGPAIPAGEAVRGGTGIFKAQAACPFRAFAEFRLGAAPLQEAQAGLSPLERGSLLHRAMEFVWEKIPGHAALCALQAHDVQEIVFHGVREAVTEMAQRYPHTFTAKFRELECRRLEKLIVPWLEMEKSRSPFEVARREQSLELEVGGIQLTTKVDRIDVLPDGRKVVIDYKTNRPDVKNWFGSRPDEPQLPLYATALKDELAAVMFAQVRLGEMAFKGLANEPDVAPGVTTLQDDKRAAEYSSWEALLESWRQVLQDLGEDFRAGRAVVDPKEFPATCRYCEIGPLCRIKEIMSERVADEEAGDE